MIFLQGILEYNGYTVVVVANSAAEGGGGGGGWGRGCSGGGTDAGNAVAAAPETFTVGVTDVMFNAVNAVFGRLLKAPGGHIVTLAYWQQKEKEPA